MHLIITIRYDKPAKSKLRMLGFNPEFQCKNRLNC